MNLERAISIAADAHSRQVDFNGKPIILHALRVMLAVPEQLQIAAVLHDVVEDTIIDPRDLEALGIGYPDLEIVDALTRRKDETYFDYIRRLQLNPDAVRIKIADIKDNMRPERAHPRSPTSRYLKALDMLMPLLS